MARPEIKEKDSTDMSTSLPRLALPKCSKVRHLIGPERVGLGPLLNHMPAR
jgi:hypothetical protein